MGHGSLIHDLTRDLGSVSGAYTYCQSYTDFSTLEGLQWSLRLSCKFTNDRLELAQEMLTGFLPINNRPSLQILLNNWHWS